MPHVRTYAQVKEEDALDVIKKSIVIDALTYIPMLTDISYIDRLLTSGVITGIHITMAEPSAESSLALSRIAEWRKIIRENSNKLLLVNGAGDIEKAKARNVIAIIGGLQNTTPIEHDLRLLEAFHKLGVRILQIAYYEQNYAGSGCYEGYTRVDSGLTHFGRKIVEECNKLGILIDLSHCSDKTTLDTIEHSKDPVAITHVASRTMCDGFRNKPDELIKATAEKGGVIGVFAWSPFCEVKKGIRPGVDDYVSHLVHIANIAGIDHVGLGLDLSPGWPRKEFETWASQYPELVRHYTYETRVAEGIEDHIGIINITRGLIAQGYSEGEIRKILGENWLRLFRKVWKE
jgi:membrane dipeptidase